MQLIINMMARLEKDMADPKLPLSEKKYIEGKHDSCQALLSVLSKVTIVQDPMEEDTIIQNDTSGWRRT